MKLLLPIKNSIINIIKKLLGIKDSIVWGLSKRETPMPKYLSEAGLKEGLSIIIAPHADDELIGCYNYIKRHTECVVYYCQLLGSKNSDFNAEVRLKEFVSFCESENINYQIAKGDLKEDIASIIDRLHPANILIPSVIDWHPEHRLINTICYDLLDNISESYIVWYRISIPMMIYNYYEQEGRDDFDIKWEAFYTHYLSQTLINVRRFKFVEKNCISDFFAAEQFFIQNAKVFKNNYEIIMREENRLVDLKNYLNSYKWLVFKSKAIYQMIDTNSEVINKNND